MKPTDKRFWIAWTSLIILIVVWCMIDGEDKAPEYLKISSYEISQDCIKDTIYTSFAEYDEAILTHEQKIINHEGQQAVIKAKDRNNLCKSELTFIGSVLNSENDTITFLKKEDVFGQQQSPHGKGSIVVYKNRIRQGYYSDFNKGFFVKIKNNLLYLKDVKGVDLDGNPVWGDLNTINFAKGIPHNIFIYTENEWGDEHMLIRKKSSDETAR
ncbi:hypothetical protein E5360_10920 [Muribaculum intestinale]|uniref:Uncharacterized protein n=2 Tax=Muribaculaceae TaxID=2005473 RepID=A0AC61S6V8_9BACT|nr:MULTISPECIES: hypothetical protein [Bacteroidales]ROT15899.1 hypothetical protein EEL48_02215 [Muribaculaceae bacterium Isolate-102 (HZI)]TGX80353.1 hypothetical protein E5360_10920 [Muribaculum intestinale]THG53353.1 hypothetical protein E5990_04395 [Muribaculum caecicola]HBV84073.1 hypothetical protein [Lachnospiraceae bacterium]